MSDPKPGSAIYTVLNQILSKEVMSLRQLLVRAKQYPHVNTDSLHTTLTNLAQKNLIEKKKNSASSRYEYRRLVPSKPPCTKRPRPETDKILDEIKKYAGKTITVTEINRALGLKSTAAYKVMANLEAFGHVLSIISDRKHEFRVQQSILELTRVPQKDQPKKSIAPVVEPLPIELPTVTIMDMSLNELMTQTMMLRDENLRLKHSLEAIGRLLCQVGVVEHEE